ncbi:hypothetical protein ASG87_10110 [Frateuria sp. Soil773]|uniref:DUF6630 family protein n=1 Tax=Frateuria sp. Soil773 TaxID=1736407 RepID=UPI0006F83F7A|nr:hypothetical protein [Frateuria sp. Soil773]KRF02213.1 hypothetical protein ASG87_10110 [Frateuria sp. Soil773]
MNAYDDDDDHERDFDDAGEDSVEAQVWRLLLLINPGDEETALQQFAAYRDAVQAGDEGDPVEVVGRVIDWRSGFYVDAQDPRSLVQALDELAARWSLAIDWDGEPDDEEFFEDTDVAALLAVAGDRLAEFGYVVWAWEPGDGTFAGWITLARDSEPMRELAAAMGIGLRTAGELG